MEVLKFSLKIFLNCSFPTDLVVICFITAVAKIKFYKVGLNVRLFHQFFFQRCSIFSPWENVEKWNLNNFILNFNNRICLEYFESRNTQTCGRKYRAYTPKFELLGRFIFMSSPNVSKDALRCWLKAVIPFKHSLILIDINSFLLDLYRFSII